VVWQSSSHLASTHLQVAKTVYTWFINSGFALAYAAST
jgi:hypothetical protein